MRWNGAACSSKLWELSGRKQGWMKDSGEASCLPHHHGDRLGSPRPGSFYYTLGLRITGPDQSDAHQWPCAEGIGAARRTAGSVDGDPRYEKSVSPHLGIFSDRSLHLDHPVRRLGIRARTMS